VPVPLRWASIRAKGRNHFIFRTGVFGYGGAMFAMLVLFPVLSGRGATPALYIVAMLLVFAAGGWAWATFTWFMSEKSFANISRSKPNQSLNTDAPKDSALVS
jgi:hypothetical protein